MTSRRRWWAELAWLGGPDATAGVLIEADNEGKIVGVQPGSPRPDSGDVEVLRGLTLPGLVNSHSHAFHRALRGWTQSYGGDFWSWRKLMYRVAGSLDPDTYLDLATAVYAEMVLAGITTVGEFHYLHHDRNGRPYNDHAMEAAVVEAATMAGIRLTLIDTCYLAGGVGSELQGAQVRFSDGNVDAWSDRLEASSARLAGPTVRFAAGVHSVRAVPRAAIGQIAAYASKAKLPVHAHVSEQPAENDECLAAYSMTPTQLLSDEGLIGASFTAVHATHLNANDVELLGSGRSAVCMCPTTERDLADGIGKAAALGEAGAYLCLGSDSHAVIDLFEESRAVELDERLATGRRGSHDPVSLLKAATSNGSASLGWGGGRLVVGAPADFCTLDCSGVELAGTFTADGRNAISAAVFAGTAASIDNVVVSGRTSVRDGEHVGVPDTAGAIRRCVGALLDGDMR